MSVPPLSSRTLLTVASLLLTLAPASRGRPADGRRRPRQGRRQPCFAGDSGRQAHPRRTAGSPAGRRHRPIRRRLLRDLTPFSAITCEPADLVSIEGGYLTPRKNGTGVLVVQAGGQSLRVPLIVQDLDKPQPVSFRRDLIAAMNVGGCNAGACHGTPSGKNGFKLSLRGFDPAADYLQLTRDVLGRRTDRSSPGRQPVSAEGARPGAPRRRPAFRRQQRAGRRHPRLAGRGPAGRPGRAAAAARASTSCPARACRTRPVAGSSWPSWPTSPTARVRDVTRLTVFSSSDPAVADVSRRPAWSSSSQPGEVAILCRYLDAIADGPPDLSRAAQGLRLDQPAREQLRRQARLRQAEDAEHPAVGPVHRRGIRPPRLPGRVRHPAQPPRKPRPSWPTASRRQAGAS